MIVLEDGVIVRSLDENDSVISDYYYFRNQTYKIIRGGRILVRTAEDGWNPTTGFLDPYMNQSLLIYLVNEKYSNKKYSEFCIFN